MAAMALFGIFATAQTGGSKGDGKLRIIAFGAHPDDCEIKAGGVGAKWLPGPPFKFVSVTNGDIGHWKNAGGSWRSAVKWKS